MGNRHARWSPQGVYSCGGTDRWVAITVVTDEGWTTLCGEAGLDDLVTLDRPARETGQADIDRRLEEWTSSLSQAEVVAALAAPGLAVAPVADAQQVSDDPHLAARDSFVSVDHPAAGLEVWPRTPIRIGGAVLDPRRPAPRLGADNRRVLVEEVGLEQAVHDDLSARGGLTTSPPG